MRPSATAFAKQTFGQAELGDRRRTRALVALASQLARKPAGKITSAFKKSALRERAYRFVENPAIRVSSLLDALGSAFALRLEDEPMAYAVIDGSSLALADPQGRKDFGRIGSDKTGARGLKVITAYGVDRLGAPLGVITQEYWARQERVDRGRSHNSRNRGRKVHEKETQRWLEVISQTGHQPESRKLWFLIDREGDSREILQALARSGSRFTVRSSWNRALVAGRSGRRRHLRAVMAKAPVIADYTVEVPAGPNRRARTARMRVRAGSVRLLMKNRWNAKTYELDVNVVWAREVDTTPRGEKPLDWMLLTNAPIATADEVFAVIRSYQMRWRIEDFHKTWKSGHCNVEDTQLHSAHATTIFAIMHAAVAARAERLKHLARETPDQPAAVELTLEERTAIAALAHEELSEPPAPGGRRQSKLTVPDPKTMTLEVAVFWLARLGGYTGKSSGGPPGGITIGRGLEDVQAVARAIPALRRLTGK